MFFGNVPSGRDRDGALVSEKTRIAVRILLVYVALMVNGMVGLCCPESQGAVIFAAVVDIVCGIIWHVV